MSQVSPVSKVEQMTHRFPRRQRGSVLMVGLIFLVLIMLIGITALGSTVLQERMTGGQRNESLAYHGAESTLRGAEGALWDTYVASDGRARPTGTRDVEPLDATAAAFRNDDETFAGSTAYAKIDYDALPAKSGGGKLARDPGYLIEYVAGIETGCLESHCGDSSLGSGSVGLTDWFRITARSAGGDTRVVRTTESVYAMGR